MHGLGRNASYTSSSKPTATTTAETHSNHRLSVLDKHPSNAVKGFHLLVFDDQGSEAARQNERWEYPGDRVVEGDYGCLQANHRL